MPLKLMGAVSTGFILVNMVHQEQVPFLVISVFFVLFC